MRNILLTSAFVLFAAGCSKEDNEAEKTASSTQSINAKAFADTFVKACVYGNQQQNAEKFSQSDSEKICTCSLNTLLETYSVERLSSVVNSSNTEQTEFAKKAMNARMACDKKLKDNKL